MAADDTVLEDVRRYYGEVLGSSKDLKTNACCPAEAPPAWLQRLLADIHPEIRERFYGCGSPIPPALDGCTVLDLGCGTGRDVYLLSRLVGPKGRVIGVDMTAQQLEVARRHAGHHMRRYGYARSNVEFHQGWIEDLTGLGIADASVDVVVSNCVINLSPAKHLVLQEVFRVLKPGGELYFSDVFADRRVPAELARDPVLRGECLGGALYWEDFRRLLQTLGCADARRMSSSPIRIQDPAVEQKIGFVNFSSVTVRAFKLQLEDRCEDFGQVATYRGTMPEHPHRFALDDHHLFEAGKPLRVCGNTADMLAATRFAPHFEVAGDKTRHYGLFDCAPAASTPSSDGACC